MYHCCIGQQDLLYCMLAYCVYCLKDMELGQMIHSNRRTQLDRLAVLLITRLWGICILPDKEQALTTPAQGRWSQLDRFWEHLTL